MQPHVPSKPFVRGRFDALPAVPPIPHVFHDAECLTLPMQSASFGAIDVHVRRYGKGPPLYLVHGLMTSSYSWRYAFAHLGEHFTCFALDLPGAGRTTRNIDRPYSPTALATLIGEVQAALDIRGCPTIGNSMGGYLCMTLALDDPGAMSRLLNLHSPGVPELRLDALAAILAVPGAHALLRSLIRRDPLRWVFRNVHYYDEHLKSLEEAHEYGDVLADRDGAQVLVKYLGETMHPRPMRAFQAGLTERKQRGQAFPIPLQLVYADRDPMVPPRFGEVFREQIPGSELVTMSDASHFAHVDAAARFAAMPCASSPTYNAPDLIGLT